MNNVPAFMHVPRALIGVWSTQRRVTCSVHRYVNERTAMLNLQLNDIEQCASFGGRFTPDHLREIARRLIAAAGQAMVEAADRHASTGIEQAIGRHVDIAINHDADAIGMHEINHPQTRHNAPRPVSDPIAPVLTGGHKMLLAPTLVQVGYGERKGQAPRALDPRDACLGVIAGMVSSGE